MDQTIDDIYVNYLLCDKNFNSLKKLSNKSIPTLRNYINIKENLHDDLYKLFSTKKITISIALYLCNHIHNPYHQIHMFPLLNSLSTPMKKNQIKVEKFCDICSNESKLFELTPCCQTKICLECLFKTIVSSLSDIQFKLISCPFCRHVYSLEYLYSILKVDNMISIEPWRNKHDYNQIIYRFKMYYLHNTFHKYKYNLQQIIHSNHIDRNSLEVIKQEMDSFIYSDCQCCLQKWYGNNRRFNQNQYHKINHYMKRVPLGKIRKQCINNDVVLKRNMFMCEPCFDKNNSGEFKKCPHCGIKTLKPDGCNFVKCECGNRWCFVCNLRLPNTHEGHNVHYYIGHGSSAYDDKCRISTNYKGEKHILQECGCLHCSQRNGAPLCANVECYHSTEFNKKYILTKKGLFYNLQCNSCLGI